ncbi:MAG: hypothetical protein COA79_10770 [Planctomycetota bacterium]|nr:MAG: hypothetical protein COA79_10770 [Planctomycetota bacterium]
MLYLHSVLLIARTIKKKYKTGEIRLVYNVVKGKREGSYEKFYINGKHEIKSNYKKGHLHGKFERFNNKGELISLKNYVDGKINGEVIEYIDHKIVKKELWINGISAFPKSKNAIKKTFEEIKKLPVKFIGQWPKTSLPEARFTESVKKANKEGLTALRYYRYLAGVPYKELAVNRNYIAKTVAATDICQKIGGITHNPTNPGLPKKEFNFCREGTSKSNLFASDWRMSTTFAVQNFMFDTDARNLHIMGHRRWCLNPTMGSTGFSTTKKFSAMYAVDLRGSKKLDFDYIAWPAKGYMPLSSFGKKYAWTLSLNPKKYYKTSATNTKVNIYEVDDEYNIAEKPIQMKSYTVNNEYVGMNSSCLIFLPKDLKYEDGATYCVRITRLKAKKRYPRSIEYFVSFYSMN